MPEVSSLTEALNTPVRNRGGRPRKTRNPNEMSYLLKGIPRDQWRKFKAKAELEGTTVKRVLLSLVNAWVET